MSIAAGQTPGRSVSPTRRTSAPRKRGDDTRAKIIDETVRCIVEEGFAAATAKHVAERAGVTWGVIQYHFGDRNGLLMAVVDDGVDQADRKPVVGRCQRTAAARAHRGGRRHRVELLQQPDLDGGVRDPAGHPRRPGSSPSRRHLLEMNSAIGQLGRLITDDPANAGVAEVIWATLRGVVLAQMITGTAIDWQPGATRPDRHGHPCAAMT